MKKTDEGTERFFFLAAGALSLRKQHVGARIDLVTADRTAGPVARRSGAPGGTVGDPQHSRGVGVGEASAAVSAP
jgi:hypothetical protein